MEKFGKFRAKNLYIEQTKILLDTLRAEEFPSYQNINIPL